MDTPMISNVLDLIEENNNLYNCGNDLFSFYLYESVKESADSVPLTPLKYLSQSENGRIRSGGYYGIRKKCQMDNR